MKILKFVVLLCVVLSALSALRSQAGDNTLIINKMIQEGKSDCNDYAQLLNVDTASKHVSGLAVGQKIVAGCELDCQKLGDFAVLIAGFKSKSKTTKDLVDFAKSQSAFKNCPKKTKKF